MKSQFVISKLEIIKMKLKDKSQDYFAIALYPFYFFDEKHLAFLKKYEIEFCGLNSEKHKKIENQFKFSLQSTKLVSTLKQDKYCYIFYSKNNSTLKELYNFFRIIKKSKLRIITEIQFYKDSPGYSASDNSGAVSSQLASEDFLVFYQDKSKFIAILWEKYFQIINKKTRTELENKIVKTVRLLNDADYFYESHLKLIFLVMILEMISLSGDKEAVKFKIRRTIAVLVGYDKELSERIYQNLSKIYDDRSSVLHSASDKHLDKIDLEKIDYLYCLVSEIAVTLLLIKDEKNKTVFDLANQIGFGEREKLIDDKYKVHKNDFFIDNKTWLYRTLKK